MKERITTWVLFQSNCLSKTFSSARAFTSSYKLKLTSNWLLLVLLLSLIIFCWLSQFQWLIHYRHPSTLQNHTPKASYWGRRVKAMKYPIKQPILLDVRLWQSILPWSLSIHPPLEKLTSWRIYFVSFTQRNLTQPPCRSKPSIGSPLRSASDQLWYQIIGTQAPWTTTIQKLAIGMGESRYLSTPSSSPYYSIWDFGNPYYLGPYHITVFSFQFWLSSYTNINI